MVDLFSTTVLPEEITSLLLFDNVPLGVVFQFYILQLVKSLPSFIYLKPQKGTPFLDIFLKNSTSGEFAYLKHIVTELG